MIEINLIPDVKQELLRAQRIRSMVISGSIIASVAALTLVVLLTIYVFGAQSIRGALVDGDITKKGDQLAAIDDVSKMITLQHQLAVLPGLQEDKAMTSRVFDMLSAVIPPSPNEAKISQISLDTEQSTVRLEGQTRAFDSMEIFKKTIDAAVLVYREEGAAEDTQVKLATDISTTDVSYGEDAEGNKTLRFTITFTYPDELLMSKLSTVSFKLIVNGNVTDSYLGIPKTIFTSEATGE